MEDKEIIEVTQNHFLKYADEEELARIIKDEPSL